MTRVRSELTATFGHLLDALPDGVVIADEAGGIQLANRQTEVLFGYEHDALLGQPVELLMPERFRSGHPTHRAEYAAQPRLRPMGTGLQLTGRRQDGSEFPVELSLSPVLVTDMRLVLATIRDVSAQRQLEQQARDELAGRLAMVQAVLDELPVGAYLARGQDAELVLANRQVATIWGGQWQPGQPMAAFLAATGARAYDLQGHELAFEDLATVRALRTGHSVRQHQEVIRYPDGTALSVLVNAIALDATAFPYLAGGLHPSEAHPSAAQPTTLSAPESHPPHPPRPSRIPLVLVVHQDVGSLKEAERLKDEFVALAAHELRNPVAALLGYAQLLADAATARLGSLVPGTPGRAASAFGDRSAEQRQRGEAAYEGAAGPDTPAEPHIPREWQEEAVAAVVEAAQRLTALTDDLLDATRLQANRLTLRREPMELGALLRRVVRRTQVSTRGHAITLSLPGPDEPVVVEADVGRLEQVVVNLLSNAIKYTSQGGPIAVTLAVRDAVTVAAGQATGTGTWAQVSIRDQGLGIPADQYDRIFTRFGRADNVREAGISGTGMGLFLCRELVERHGGHIWFTSVEGVGTTFTFEVPCWTEPPERTVPAKGYW